MMHPVFYMPWLMLDPARVFEELILAMANIYGPWLSPRS